MEKAQFIYIEDGEKDLIFSFCLEDEETGGRGLILLRSPPFEHFLYENERGVSVSLEGDYDEDEDPDLLKEFVIKQDIVTINTVRKSYEIYIGRLGSEEKAEIYPFICKMNFDNSFRVINA